MAASGRFAFSPSTKSAPTYPEAVHVAPRLSMWMECLLPSGVVTSEWKSLVSMPAILLDRASKGRPATSRAAEWRGVRNRSSQLASAERAGDVAERRAGLGANRRDCHEANDHDECQHDGVFNCGRPVLGSEESTNSLREGHHLDSHLVVILSRGSKPTPQREFARMQLAKRQTWPIEHYAIFPSS